MTVVGVRDPGASVRPPPACASRATRPPRRVASQQIRALCLGIRSDPVQTRVALPAANPPDHGYPRPTRPPLLIQDPHDFPQHFQT